MNSSKYNPKYSICRLYSRYHPTQNTINAMIHTHTHLCIHIYMTHTHNQFNDATQGDPIPQMRGTIGICNSFIQNDIMSIRRQIMLSMSTTVWLPIIVLSSRIEYFMENNFSGSRTFIFRGWLVASLSLARTNRSSHIVRSHLADETTTRTNYFIFLTK